MATSARLSHSRRPADTYTLPDGKRVPLAKRPDQFVVRVPPEVAASAGWQSNERVSPHSTRVTTSPAALDQQMDRARELAPTHHAYETASTGEEFLITDRVIVTFKAPPSEAELGSFMARYALVLLRTYSAQEFLFQVTDQTGMNPVKLVVQLSEQEPWVIHADHDLNLRVSRAQIALPTDPSYTREWHLHPHFLDAAVDPRSSARCEGAWQLLESFRPRGRRRRCDRRWVPAGPWRLRFACEVRVVGILRREHAGHERVALGRPTKMYQQGANHGTSCAGVIAGEVDAVLAVGAAPGLLGWCRSSGSRTDRTC